MIVVVIIIIITDDEPEILRKSFYRIVFYLFFNLKSAV